MRARVFYVINLDKNRIIYLSVVFTGLILIAFATGYRMGVSSATAADTPQTGSLSSQHNADEVLKSEPKNAAIAESETERKSGSRWFSFLFREEKFPEEKTAEKPGSISFTEDEAKSLREIAVTDNKSAEADAPSADSLKDQPTKSRLNPKAALLDSETLSLSNVSPPAKRESGNYRYSFQIATFNEKARAEAMAQKLRRDGFEPFIEKIGDKYAVKTGQADSRRELWNLESRLKSRNYSFFLTERK